MNSREYHELKEQLDRIERLLSQVTSPSPAPGRELDPSQVQLEDQRLLAAKQTMSDAEYKVFHAEIMANRLDIMGHHQHAARMRKKAYKKGIPKAA